MARGQRNDRPGWQRKLDLFLLGTLAGKSATRAYLEAGYAGGTANSAKNNAHLWRKAHMGRLAELERRVRAVAAGEEEPGVDGQMSLFDEDNAAVARAVADAAEAQKRLTAIARMQWTEEVALGSGAVVRKRPSFRDVISAIEKLGKMQGWLKNGRAAVSAAVVM